VTRAELVEALVGERWGPLPTPPPATAPPVVADDEVTKARRRRVLRDLPTTRGRHPTLRRVS